VNSHGQSPSPPPKRVRFASSSRSPSPTKLWSLPHKPCDECDHFLEHLRTGHDQKSDDICKKLVEAWFHGKLRVIDRHRNKISKGKFLKEEINVFLHSAGLPEWDAQSPLYRWFLSDVNKLSRNEIKASRPWRLVVRKTSKEEYRQLLKKLVQEIESDGNDAVAQ
jgi:hypothetical protein